MQRIALSCPLQPSVHLCVSGAPGDALNATSLRDPGPSKPEPTAGVAPLLPRRPAPRVPTIKKPTLRRTGKVRSCSRASYCRGAPGSGHPSLGTLLDHRFPPSHARVSLALAEQKNQESLAAMEQLGGIRPLECSIGAPKRSPCGILFSCLCVSISCARGCTGTDFYLLVGGFAVGTRSARPLIRGLDTFSCHFSCRLCFALALKLLSLACCFRDMSLSGQWQPKDWHL